MLHILIDRLVLSYKCEIVINKLYPASYRPRESKLHFARIARSNGILCSSRKQMSCQLCLTILDLFPYIDVV